MTSPAPALDPAVRKLRNVRDLASLVTYLHEELEWPVAEYDFEDLVYDVTPQEAGLDVATEAKVRSIKRLRPLSNDQPWGIFFIDFVPGDLPITVLRRILRAVSIKKREQGRADRKAWQTDDLLFISVLGEEGDRDLNLAHFNQDPAANRATLRVVEWDAHDTAFAILRTHKELQSLAWRRQDESDDQWRERWAAAFALRPREVAQTAKALASQMAQLAKLIRERVNAAIAVENEKGPLRELHAAFKEVLLHDLTEDGFADMYAQTMTYGLFAARQSRPAALTLDTAVEMIPNTNPFLRDLLAQFTTANGLTHALDFDELGVDALIDTLQNANMEAVVADFGRAKPGEDPVIHFYEDFLREYNKAQKIQRGVFYTPKPVVSFIVRSVHELLQTEFQLPDGLASTETWADMIAKFPDLKIPEGATPATPFVQVLDPACGTGTFLVEVIQLIHDTMNAKWEKQGIRHGSFQWQEAWNDYVAKHLLTRIYGFELMMASYTIAHMKVGLKLGELGYKFAAAERLRIYLTNTLEPPQDFRGMFDIMAPALAHEAHAVNEVKRETRFTVVIGNPPYSNYGQANRNPWILGLLAAYKAGLTEKKINLDDDFIKFIRYSHWQLHRSGVGVLGFISNNTFLDGITHRVMRKSLLDFFARAAIVDLGGDVRRRAGAASAASLDENVFDIQQGVAITLACRSPRDSQQVRFTRLRGSRSTKYQALADSTFLEGAEQLAPGPSDYMLVGGAPAPIAGPGEYSQHQPLDEMFGVFQNGIKTDRDELFFSFQQSELVARFRTFYSPSGLKDPFRSDYRVEDSSSFSLLARRAATSFDENAVVECAYRPFDQRYLYYKLGLTSRPAWDVMRHLLGGSNLALLVCRQQAEPGFNHVFATRTLAECCVVSNKTREITSAFPLYVKSDLGLDFAPNIHPAVLERFGAVAATATAEVVFAYIYAVLHAPSYRRRFESELQRGFPRIPVPIAASLLSDLAQLGDVLLQAHTMESDFGSPTNWHDAGDRAVRRLEYQASGSKRVEINDCAAFAPMPEEVWSFRVGSYQPAQKWLKDRRGRVLTDEDIEHYKRIIGAITETIRIQKEIDEVIEAHGGWPGAFQGGEE